MQTHTLIESHTYMHSPVYSGKARVRGDLTIFSTNKSFFVMEENNGRLFKPAVESNSFILSLSHTVLLTGEKERRVLSKKKNPVYRREQIGGYIRPWFNLTMHVPTQQMQTHRNSNQLKSGHLKTLPQVPINIKNF